MQLNYGKYKHRYVPKLSSDKKTWKIIDAQRIKVDSITGIATLNLSVSSQKLYVAAQEVESSENTYSWIDELLIKHPEIKKRVTGKTVLNKNNYVLELEADSIVNTIVLIARQHPPEIPGGTVAFKAFFEELMLDKDEANTFRKNNNFYVFPLLHPDGADMGN